MKEPGTGLRRPVPPSLSLSSHSRGLDRSSGLGLVSEMELLADLGQYFGLRCAALVLMSIKVSGGMMWVCPWRTSD